ncbi:MAG: energy transducer TonB [Myxococcales bacterium]|nr:energy transducer TonB [Myxococcales bacterium]
MVTRDERQVARLAVAVLVSALVHVGTYAALDRVLDLTPPEPPPARPVPERPIPILSEEEVDRLIAMAPKLPPPPKVTAPTEPPPPPPPPPPAARPDGQVVEIPPPPREEVPDDARLLSDYNSKVEKEMVSANLRAPTPKMRKSDRRLLSPGDDENGKSTAENRKRPDDSPSKRRDDRPGDAERPGKTPGPAAKPGEERPKVAEPKPNPLPAGDGVFKPAVEPSVAEQATPGGGGNVGGAQAPANWTALLPTLGPEDMDRQDGSIDHIEDMEKGAETFLNTRDYQYAWFFNRVKRSVQQRWRALEAHRRHDPYGRIYGVRDRQTVVEVTLDPEGALEDIIITKDSGVAFLDEAAVAAFQDAQPFPNPPAGLKDADGRIRFRFSFFLEINSRGMRFLPSRPPR